MKRERRGFTVADADRATFHSQRIRLCVEGELLGMQDDIALPSDRLMEAVDCVLVGLAEMDAAHAGKLPSSLLGSVDQPRAFCDLTSDEVIAAERFLLRCGFLTAPDIRPSHKLH